VSIPIAFLPVGRRRAAPTALPLAPTHPAAVLPATSSPIDAPRLLLVSTAAAADRTTGRRLHEVGRHGRADVLVAARRPAADAACSSSSWDRRHVVERWSPATGTPKAIYGSGLPLLGWREDRWPRRGGSPSSCCGSPRPARARASEFRGRSPRALGQTWSGPTTSTPRPAGDWRPADVACTRSAASACSGAAAWPIPATSRSRRRSASSTPARTAWQQVGLQLADAPQRGTGASRARDLGDALAAALAPFALAWEIPSARRPQRPGPHRPLYIDATTRRAALHERQTRVRFRRPRPCGAGERRQRRGPRLPATGNGDGVTRTGNSAVSALANVPSPACR